MICLLVLKALKRKLDHAKSVSDGHAKQRNTLSMVRKTRNGQNWNCSDLARWTFKVPENTSQIDPADLGCSVQRHSLLGFGLNCAAGNRLWKCFKSS